MMTTDGPAGMWNNSKSGTGERKLLLFLGSGTLGSPLGRTRDFKFKHGLLCQSKLNKGLTSQQGGY